MAAAAPIAAAAPAVTRTPAVLIFSKTAGFRHGSIPVGIEALRVALGERGYRVEATEDAAAFTDANLNRFDCVVFLSTTGDVLNDTQQAAFERYIGRGRGFAGIHAAADTEYDWPFYGQLVGAYFKSHPAIQPAVVVVEDQQHLSTQHLPQQWNRRDEWYDFRTNPREEPRIRILASMLEGSYQGSTMGPDHPIAWCQEYGGGRAWYTAGGHTDESFAEPEFVEHLVGGIEWAVGGE